MTGVFAFGQFKDKLGNDVKDCDCKDPIRDLDIVMTLPENYIAYDYIQFVLYAGTSGISQKTMQPDEIINGTVKLNVLNSENKPYRTEQGVEYGRFQGDDFTWASFNSLCEYEEDFDIYVITYGISQIGTETVHTIDPTGTKITSRTFDIFDDGVELSRSETARFRPDIEYAKKINSQWKKDYRVKLISIAASIGAIAAAIILL